ncbi:MAG: acyl-CoA dehydrogenase family protein [Acidimicrobiales bacterium]|nr:acyl-CoA dehydrogenase family protein [Acidimicrobiales bacterium]
MTAQPPTDRDAWPVMDATAFRAVVRKWITANWSTGITVREWWRRLADAGLTVPTWSSALGGISATTSIQQVIEDELGRIVTVAPPLGGVGVHLVGPVLRQFGAGLQRDRHLRSIVDGTSNWCLLIDEPDGLDDAGSVASLGTRDGAGWAIDAVKMSTDADLADRGLLLVRTTPGSTGRDGLSCFLLALDQPTISVQRLSSGSSVVVCHGATADAHDLVGDAGNGWQVAQTVFAHQQTSLAGRIRRGLVDVPSGEKAGNLERTTGDVLTRTLPRRMTGIERRRS